MNDFFDFKEEEMDCKEFIQEAQEHQNGKVCCKCKEHQPLSEFFKHRIMKDGLDRQCKSCYKKYRDNECVFKRWFATKKSHAKRPYKKGNLRQSIQFTIKPEDIPGVKIRELITISRRSYENKDRKYVSWEAVEYPKVCPVFGMKLDWGMNGLNGNCPSLDRIDSTKGYIPGNIIIMSNLANAMKSNATPEQLKQFSRYHLFGVKND
tara:strand:- start:3034 stop:3654 length:621 start_codon:yes stop_codon:yes gene_type:complete